MAHRRSSYVGAFGLVLLTAAGVVEGCRTLSDNAVSEDVVRAALSAGNYAEAETLAREWVARLEQQRGRDRQLTDALDWLVTGLLENGKAGDPKTLALAERAVADRERLTDSRTVDTARSLSLLGRVRLERGEMTLAMRAFERAVGIHNAAGRPDEELVADTLDYLALSLIRLERFPDAERHLAESLRIRERAPNRQIALAGTLELIGTLHRFAGRYSAAVPPLERALAVRTRLLPNHPDALTALQVRGDVALLMGDTAGARRFWSSALELAERTLRPDHPVTADVLRRLGIAAFAMGQLAEARRLVERGRSIGERSLAPCDPLKVGLAIGAGDSLRYDGEYTEARKVYRDTLSTVRKCIAAGEADLTADAEATLVFNDAEIARDVGDLIEADQLFARAVEIWSTGLRPDHPFVAKGLDAQADVAASRGQLSRAEALYERALTVRRTDLGDEHPTVAWTLTSLARTVADRGDLPLALRYVQQALAIYRKSGASDEPDHFPRVLALQGALEARRGNLEAARASLSQALGERTRIFGGNHPLVAESRAALARVEFARGRATTALRAALEAEESGREHLLFTVRYLPERQALLYAAKRPRGLDLALEIITSTSPPSVTEVFDAVVRSRGMILDEFAARHRAAVTTTPQTKSLVTAATSARQRFANLLVRSLQEPVPRTLLDDARQQKDDAERTLAESSAETRAELARVSAGLDDIRSALPRDAALVAYVRFGTHRDIAGLSRAAPASDAYAAFVIEPDSHGLALVPLGRAKRIDQLVGIWHAEASGSSIAAHASAGRAARAYFEASTRLRGAIWDPLMPHVASASRVFVVPDGLVNVVNLAALQDHDGRYLVEREPVIHYLTTERDLLLPQAQSAAVDTLLAVGGPAFDNVAPATRSGAVRRSVDCPPLASVRFDNLPGSLSEIDEISALWPKTPGSQVTLLRGPAATESAVKQAVSGRRIVHLATHGFFLSTECVLGPPGLRAVGGLTKALEGRPASNTSENPLVLTGLALAGANNWSTAALDQDEGLLTAEEITGLNLQGTAWAVLSACATGLGEIQAGEGVFGLRRAFQIAGARTVIMSLWSVEDESTREWMRALYEGRLRRNLDTASAIREANLALLRDRRGRGQSTLPFYWAAFVAAGDWR